MSDLREQIFFTNHTSFKMMYRKKVRSIVARHCRIRNLLHHRSEIKQHILKLFHNQQLQLRRKIPPFRGV